MHDELETCNLLLSSDVDRLHVRKPSYSKAELESYLQQLDFEYANKISLHAHHELVDKLGLGGKHFSSNTDMMSSKKLNSKSFHSMNEINKEQKSLSYGFLSPIFDSISKVGYKSHFEFDQLKKQLLEFVKFPVYALGGINWSRMNEVNNLGFDGVALLGAIWHCDHVKNRIKIVEQFINV